MRKNLLSVFFFLVGLGMAFAQNPNNIIIAKAELHKQADKLGLDRNEIDNFKVSDHYISKYNNAAHLYLWQTKDGVPVYNGIITFGIKNNEIYNLVSNAVKNIDSKLANNALKISPEQAIKSAAEQLGFPNNEMFTRLSKKDENNFVYNPTSFASNNIPVFLCYEKNKNGTYSLAWNVDLDIPGSDYWSVRLDAETGIIISQNNYTVYCAFDHEASHSHGESCKSNFAQKQTKAKNSNEAIVNNIMMEGSYKVYAVPAESPNHGQHEIVVNPADVEASPYGWHDTDGMPGAEFTITRGNNVHAYLDKNIDDTSDGSEPDGGVDLVFDFSHNKALEPVDSERAAQVNLFYMNNILHDFTYRYGFDEAAGNFQQNNYGNGGQGGDYVRAESADGSGTNNANFSTPADGGGGRMQMFLWGGSEFDLLTVNNPVELQGLYEVRSAGFGPPITNVPVTGNLIFVNDGGPDPTTGCDDLINGDELAGNIAMIDRGLCDFSAKVYNAQQAGAIGAIVCNIVGVSGGNGSEIFNMGAGDNADLVTIPSIMVTYQDCQKLRASINSDIPVNATIQLPVVTGPMNLDASYDNGVIAHEFGHGISNRLTGGPSQAGCLGNDEQMGEGWSDFFALITSHEPGDQGNDARGIGTYVSGESVTGGGIRDFPYSTDMGISPKTYKDIIGTTAPHPLGEVWAASCWDLYWAMIDEYGYDADINNLESGNAKAIRLVMEGMKEQGCSPGFVSGRDGILIADATNYNGENYCLISRVFARRGIGANADQNDANNRGDGIENFDVPTGCLDEILIKKTASTIVTPGDNFDVSIVVSNYKQLPVTGVVVTDQIPTGTSYVAGSSNITATVSGDIITFELGDMEYEEIINISYELLSDSGSKSETFFLDDMEDGDGNWDIGLLEGTEAFWELTDLIASSGEEAWYIANPETETDNTLFLLDYIDIIGERPVLKFNHLYNTEAGSDGGFVSVQEEGQNNWTRLNYANNIRNGFNITLAYGTFAIPSLASFSGSTDNEYIDTYLDLSAYKGKKIKLQFRFGTDANTAPTNGNLTGWSIDDVELMDLKDYSGEACVTDDSGFNACDNSLTVVESDGIVALNNIEADDYSMDLFPNPASKVVNIRLAVQSNENAVLNIYTVDGLVVTNQNLTLNRGTETIQLPIENLATGVYFVQLRGEKNTSIKRLIVE